MMSRSIIPELLCPVDLEVPEKALHSQADLYYDAAIASIAVVRLHFH